MSETAILEPTQHRMKQQTVGYKQDKKEGSKLGGLYTSDGRQGCATLETLRAELPLILAQTPALLPAMVSALLTGLSVCFIFLALSMQKVGHPSPLRTEADIQVPGNGAEGALPQTLPGLLLLSLK